MRAATPCLLLLAEACYASASTIPSAAGSRWMGALQLTLCTELQRFIRIRLKFSFQTSVSPNGASMNVQELQSCSNLCYTAQAAVYQAGCQPPPRQRVLASYHLSITLFSGEKLRDLSLDLCYHVVSNWMKEETVGQPGEVRCFTEVYACQSLPLASSVSACARYVRAFIRRSPFFPQILLRDAEQPKDFLASFPQMSLSS